MGMFDTFIIEINNEEVEVQTKRFDCILQEVRVGETMNGTPMGLQFFYDIDTINDKHVGIVIMLYDGIFVDYKIALGDHSEDIDVELIKYLMEKLRIKHEYLDQRLSTLLKEQNKKLQQKENIISNIKAFCNLIKSEDLDKLNLLGALAPYSEYFDRYSQGEELSSLILSMIEDKSLNVFLEEPTFENLYRL